MAVPRGIRNNNPGNIDRTAERWQGMAADQSSDPRFAVFIAPVWGLRAIGKVLLSYYRKYGIRTVESIVSRWAPSAENDSDAYAQAVARSLRVAVRDELNIEHPEVLARLIAAIVQHENGQQPYPPELIEQAVRLALE